jgi:hypothetical protein
MLAVFSPCRAHLQALLDGLAPMEPRVVLADWQRLEQGISDVDCVLICIEWLAENDGLTRLGDLRSAIPGVPIVLVTRKEADNARLLKGLVLEEVVWLHEARAALAGAVARAFTCGLIQLLRTALSADRRLSPRLREALLYACQRDHSIYSVAILARAVRCDRRTLWHGWHRAVGATPRLEDFLNWLLLLRAAALKTPARCWCDVAAALDVNERTLARASSRLAGLRLSELASTDRQDLMNAFLSSVVRRILPDLVVDNLS